MSVRILFYASEVAAVCGMNSYASANEAMAKVASRNGYAGSYSVHVELDDTAVLRAAQAAASCPDSHQGAVARAAHAAAVQVAEEAATHIESAASGVADAVHAVLNTVNTATTVTTTTTATTATATTTSAQVEALAIMSTTAPDVASVFVRETERIKAVSAKAHAEIALELDQSMRTAARQLADQFRAQAPQPATTQAAQRLDAFAKSDGLLGADSVAEIAPVAPGIAQAVVQNVQQAQQRANDVQTELAGLAAEAVNIVHAAAAKAAHDRRAQAPSMARCAIGAAMEATARHQDSRTRALDVRDANAKALYRNVGATVRLCGRPDGLVRDPSTDAVVELVEYKQRMRRLFRHVPLYERVQLHVYMYLCRLTRATLCETYDGQQETHVIDFDPELWATVTGKLQEVAAEIASQGGKSDMTSFV